MTVSYIELMPGIDEIKLDHLYLVRDSFPGSPQEGYALSVEFSQYTKPTGEEFLEHLQVISAGVRDGELPIEEATTLENAMISSAAKMIANEAPRLVTAIAEGERSTSGLLKSAYRLWNQHMGYEPGGQYMCVRLNEVDLMGSGVNVGHGHLINALRCTSTDLITASSEDLWQAEFYIEEGQLLLGKEQLKDRIGQEGTLTSRVMHLLFNQEIEYPEEQLIYLLDSIYSAARRVQVFPNESMIEKWRTTNRFLAEYDLEVITEMLEEKAIPEDRKNDEGESKRSPLRLLPRIQ